MVGRAVVRLVVMMVVVMRGGESRGRDHEHAANEEEEFLHAYEHGMKGGRLSAEMW